MVSNPRGVSGGTLVSNSANQSMASGAVTALSFDTEVFKDVAGTHSTSVNPSRLTCVNPGRYLLFGAVQFAANTTGSRFLQFRKNGSGTSTDPSLASSQGAAAAGTDGISLSISDLVILSAGDYIELIVFQDAGVALNANSAVTHLAFQQLP